MQKLTQKSIAYEQIKKDIIRGNLKPGEIIQEIEVSKKYGFGRMPIREALLLLVHQKYLESLPRVGYIVTKPTFKEVLDTFYVRTLLEVDAIGLAVEHISAYEIQLLEQNNELEKALYSNPDCDSMHTTAFDLNREFHVTIANASRNERLVTLIETILDDMGRILAFDPYIADPRQHQQIIFHLKKRNKSEAQETMRNHIEETRLRVLKMY